LGVRVGAGRGSVVHTFIGKTNQRWPKLGRASLAPEGGKGDNLKDGRCCTPSLEGV
jgi:hypothetical protein